MTHPANTPLPPSDARRLGKRARAGLTQAQRTQKNRLVCANIARHPWFIKARSVALYLAGATETDLDNLLRIALQHRKVVLIPKVHRNHRMSFHRLTKHTKWCINDYGLREPIVLSRYANRYWDRRHFDLVCVPVAAFDAQFNRVGMGGGYYDRYFAPTLKQRRTHLLGVAFDAQRMQPIAKQRWDVAMHAIATEHGITMRTQATSW